MKLNIPQDVIDRTNCPHDFVCISEHEKCGGSSICNVLYKYSENAEALFVKKDPRNECPNHTPWGNWNICHCPVRFYLYTVYNI
jgi:hypothetical protein